MTKRRLSRATRWRPQLGAWPDGEGTRFRVWAPAATRVEVVIEQEGGLVTSPLARDGPGVWAAWVAGIGAGTRYRYRLEDSSPLPDPASRFQPLGVHGPSEIVDPSAFAWSDAGWQGIARERLVFYEVHVGTFTAAGTFAAAADRLSYLAELGVTAIELMPVAEFPGTRNWGYDGAALFAPTHQYGRPDDLRRLVDTAHAAGLAVVLDVVYNHLGPDGAYLPTFAPVFFSPTHQSPWGAAVNLEGPGCEMVRAFLRENALYWLHEFHLDGLRLDATHTLVDGSARHILVELAEAIHDVETRPRRFVVAEDERNLARLVQPAESDGFGLDAVWADDFHHLVHRVLTGESDGYYGDYACSLAELAKTINEGWYYQGQHSPHLGRARGTSPAGLEPARFIFCLQNHDQVGNRAFGERLTHLADAASCRAAAVLLLAAPQTPLLFMGQEWAATSPFLYFTDHEEGLGRLVTEGRRREFARFAAFADPARRGPIPDPQDRRSVESSRLDWRESGAEPCVSMLRLYRTLLSLRATHPALRPSRAGRHRAAALDARTLLLWRTGRAGRPFAALVRLAGAGETEVRLAAADLPQVPAGARGRRQRWQVLLTTEEPGFAPDPRPPDIETTGDGIRVRFVRPSAVILAPGP